MAQATYNMTGIVLRKTKLGESDLIITLVSEDGSLKKGVAKGARKPSSPFAARLELYNEADLLCAIGKSLDIIKEARLVFGGKTLHSDMDKSAAAAIAAELASRFVQPSLENPRLYEMTGKFFRTLDAGDAACACTLVAAYCLKCFSICGIRPSLISCVSCGSRLDEADSGMKAFSCSDGGYVCPDCTRAFESIKIVPGVLLWANALLYSAFDDICKMELPSGMAFDILQLCQQWCIAHIGTPNKSLRMFASLYSAEL